MTRSANDLTKLAIAVDEALQLLDGYAHAQGGASSGLSLLSLVEQCEVLLGDMENQPEETVRSLHHFACTGGTLISRCVAAMPNTVLLSEIDPLSAHYKTLGPKKFAPTDLTLHLRNNLRPAQDNAITDMFLAGIGSLHERLSGEGRRLVLRDHAHSQYCAMTEPHSRPTLKAILESRFPLRSCVTVRHPLDSYLSLHVNKWDHFRPFTLEEYCRRYLMFLDDYKGTDIVRYEDVVASPKTALAQICAILNIPFVPEALDVLDVVTLSGDSGRSGNVIGFRPRRNVPEAVAVEAESSASYKELCLRLDYVRDPAP